MKRRSPTIIEQFTVAARATAWRIFRIPYPKSNRIACFHNGGGFSHGLHPQPTSKDAARGASPCQNVNVEQWTILLAAEDVGVAGAATRYPAVYCELGRQCRFEFDVVGDLCRIDAKDLADGRVRQDTALAHPVIGGAVGENHIESNFVDAGVLAADRLG